MAQCIACNAELAVYGRRCQSCGSGALRDGSLSGLLTGKYLTQARLSHLLAIPGMLIYLVGFTEFGILSIVPLNIVAPLIYRWNHPATEAVWRHTTEALNFQVLWTAAMWVVILIVPFLGLTLWPLVWITGIALVLVMALDAPSDRNGRYPVRFPLFHHH